ncbi:MAG TPA: hypothetical protein VK184_22785 [Nostocaceae cyanobacterium]|nr:hypothetical protein [Nostocaceae cyanobacterium]
MFRYLTLALITASISTVSSVVLAQSGMPRANRQGDYYDYNSRYWIVIDTTGLNCRSGPGSNYRIVQKFDNNDKLLAPTQSGEPLIRRDRRGKPWLAVSPNGYQYETSCYVRANQSFIRPIPY